MCAIKILQAGGVFEVKFRKEFQTENIQYMIKHDHIWSKVFCFALLSPISRGPPFLSKNLLLPPFSQFPRCPAPYVHKIGGTYYVLYKFLLKVTSATKVFFAIK